MKYLVASFMILYVNADPKVSGTVDLTHYNEIKHGDHWYKKDQDVDFDDRIEEAEEEVEKDTKNMGDEIRAFWRAVG